VAQARFELRRHAFLTCRTEQLALAFGPSSAS
jgi:hypothetical protein